MSRGASARKDAPVQGRVISHYEVVRKLGQGGMGEVFEARDQLLGRAVALKLLPADKVADPDRRARFLAEARAASSLNHPHIVTIHDVVTTDDGAFCLVMERVAGRSLAEAIPPDGLPLPAALRYAKQIAGALSTAHAAGIVHRDLKPGNVMVNDRDEVKVLDFGLAKLLPTAADHEAATVTSAGTQLGLILGTPDYMSPEQATGDTVDHRSDIFSFGMLLFEMLTGRKVFRDTDRVSRLHAVVFDPAPQLSTVRPDLPAVLDSIVDRLLAKDRQARYQDFADVIDALSEVESGSGSVTSAAPPRRRWRWQPGRRAALGLAAAVLVAGAAVLLALWLGGRDSTGPGGAGAGAPASLPATASDFVGEGDRYLARYDRTGYVDQGLEAFQQALKRQPDSAPAFAGLATAYWRKYRDLRDRVWLDYAVSNARQAVDRDPLLARGHAALGLALTALGQLDDARTAFEEALTLDPNNADAMRGLGDLAVRQEDFVGAERHYLDAIASRPDDPELPSVLGGLYYRQGRDEEAAKAFARTIELAEDDYIGYKNLGAVLHMQGRFAEAARNLQRAVEIRPDASVYTNLGTLYYYQGLYQQAVTALEKSVELAANDFRSWGNLGDAYRHVPDGREHALEAYRRAAQLAERELEAGPDPEIRALRSLYLARGGNAPDAREELALVEAAKDLTAETLYVVTLAREALSERAAALDALRKALDAGHSVDEVEKDPELTELRADPRYHRMMAERSARH